MAWLTDNMGKLQRQLEIGSQSDDLARAAFSKDVLSTNGNLFPYREHEKMLIADQTYGKYTKDRMEDILRRLEDQRERANMMDKDRVQKEKEKDKVPGGGSGIKSHPTTQQTSPKPAAASARSWRCRRTTLTSS